VGSVAATAWANLVFPLLAVQNQGQLETSVTESVKNAVWRSARPAEVLDWLAPLINCLFAKASDAVLPWSQPSILHRIVGI